MVSLFGSDTSEGMKEGVTLRLTFINIILVEVFLLALCCHESRCSELNHIKDLVLVDKKRDAVLPEISPSGSPRPFLPLLAPSPLVPFTNTTVPKLSGVCMLNFTAAESLMSVTAIDCWSAFAPFLANVICCPQLEATLAILIGQTSKETNVLALNGTLAEPCLSDIEQILVGQGANDSLAQICSVHGSNLTQASCPVKDVNEFETIVDTSKLLAACKEIDPVKECCAQICQGAILEAATRVASKSSELMSMDGPHILPRHSTRVNDCKSIVLRWLASKLDPSHAKKVLRGLSNCNVNKVCPLVFPDMRNVAMGCGDGMRNQTTCCRAMESYVSHLQKQIFITNLQALDCATSLGTKLRKSGINKDVYSLCHISLKDFSLQVGNQEAGCLLPSMPSDATFDTSSGVSFLCDLNDNIPAPWPTTSKVPASSCNKTVKIPALPAVASAQSGFHTDNVMHFLPFASSMVLMMVV
ncbi:uncharacterized GPI-anchored protein At1g61900-like [Juglans microcarpa x Juglans regia]|uniref:uncharacterized GPI-anchored protein At1g61900-like n=1 Tax=Juglans microcarpa x Juglans regia TaxID=2249226 RepID=UPI001B7E678E|nr:uncharacterized GPI-anchored protein At1g61900-like [Juglans microcarpa x Juglans regia]